NATGAGRLTMKPSEPSAPCSTIKTTLRANWVSRSTGVATRKPGASGIGAAGHRRPRRATGPVPSRGRAGGLPTRVPIEVAEVAQRGAVALPESGRRLRADLHDAGRLRPRSTRLRRRRRRSRERHGAEALRDVEVALERRRPARGPLPLAFRTGVV